MSTDRVASTTFGPATYHAPFGSNRDGDAVHDRWSDARDRTVASIVHAAATYRRWRHYRRTVHALRALDRRTLQDMGLNRSNIHSTAFHHAIRHE